MGEVTYMVGDMTHPVVELQGVARVWAMPATNPQDIGNVRIVLEFDDGALACTYPGHRGKKCGHVTKVVDRKRGKRT